MQPFSISLPVSSRSPYLLCGIGNKAITVHTIIVTKNLFGKKTLLKKIMEENVIINLPCACFENYHVPILTGKIAIAAAT